MQVAREFRLGNESVTLAVNLFDRLLSAVVVPAEELQTASLVRRPARGAAPPADSRAPPPPTASRLAPPRLLCSLLQACLLLASKLLDAAPLSLRHIERYFAAIASREEVCMAELNILHYLHWDANAFTALDFLRTALQLVPAPELRASITARAEAAHEAALLGAWRRMAAARAQAPARADALLPAGCACARAPAAPSHRPFPVSAHPPAPPRPAPRARVRHAPLPPVLGGAGVHRGRLRGARL